MERSRPFFPPAKPIKPCQMRISRTVELALAVLRVLYYSHAVSSTRISMADSRGPLLGGIHDAPAGRENDLQTIDLARFAVNEHNKKANSLLEFERLVKVRQQVVAGLMYYLTIEVKEGGAKKVYEAKVWEKGWENFKQLEDFKPVGDATSA